MKYHVIPIRLAEMKKMNNIKYWEGHLYTAGAYKLIPSFWKIICYCQVEGPRILWLNHSTPWYIP